jgi:hypothetical protein
MAWVSGGNVDTGEAPSAEPGCMGFMQIWQWCETYLLIQGSCARCDQHLRFDHKLQTPRLTSTSSHMLQACGGISYVFSLYSGSIKHKMHYNQEEIDGLGTGTVSR